MTSMDDAAVIHRERDGKVNIVKKREEPTRHGALAGLGIGLAAGLSLIVVAGTDVEDRVIGLMAAADATTREQIDANLDKVDAEVAAAVDATAKAK
jgi:uncharacterized membrane protein